MISRSVTLRTTRPVVKEIWFFLFPSFVKTSRLGCRQTCTDKQSPSPFRLELSRRLPLMETVIPSIKGHDVTVAWSAALLKVRLRLSSPRVTARHGGRIQKPLSSEIKIP